MASAFEELAREPLARRPPAPPSTPPTPQLTLLPLRSPRASYRSPCWLDRRSARRALPAPQPAMLPAKQLRYDTRSSHGSPQLPQASPNPSRGHFCRSWAPTLAMGWMLTHWSSSARRRRPAQQPRELLRPGRRMLSPSEPPFSPSAPSPGTTISTAAMSMP